MSEEEAVEEATEEISDTVKCFISGMSAVLSLKNAEDAIDKGDIEDAKNEINDAVELCKEDCLGSDFVSKIKAELDKAVKSLDEKKMDEAKISLSKVVIMGFEKSK